MIFIHHWIRCIIQWLIVILISIDIFWGSRIIWLHSLIVRIIYSLFFYLSIECSCSSSCSHYSSWMLLKIQHWACKYTTSRKTISCTSLSWSHTLFCENTKTTHLDNILSFSNLIAHLSYSRKFKGIKIICIYSFLHWIARIYTFRWTR